MKRFLKYFSVMLAFVLVLTGCNKPTITKKSAKDTLTENMEKTDSVTNFSEKVALHVQFEQDGKKVDVTLGSDGKVYTEGDITTISSDVKLSTTDNMSFDIKLFAESGKDNIKLYANYMGQWIKLDTSILGDEFKTEFAKISDKKISAKEIMDYAKEVKEEKSEKEGFNKYVVTIDKDKVNSKYKETFEKTLEEAKKSGKSAEEIKEMEDEIAEYKDGILSKDLVLNVYTKDGYFAAIDIDIANIVENISGVVKDEEAKSEIKKMNISGKLYIELNDFNKVEKIVIPDEAKNGQDIMALLSSFMGGSESNDANQSMLN